MGTGYTRNDTSNNIADGNIINASDLDGEFDAVEAAFNSSTGHTHDGTSAEGAPITVVGPVQDLVVSATEVKPKTTNTLDIGTGSLQFKDLHLDGTAYLDDVQAVGAVDITGDLDVDNININGNTIISTDTNGDINISPDGTGTVIIDTDLDVDNININGNTISSTDTNGNITLAPNGTGVVALSSTDLTFGDNDKAIFGDGSDLQIYHDGLNSYIKEAGTGDLIIGGSNYGTRIQDADGNDLLVANPSSITLAHNGSPKLDTTASGVDVTGTITADGLTVDGNVEMTGNPVISNSSPEITFETTGPSHANWQIAAQENLSNAFEIASGQQDADASDDTWTKRFTVLNNGDIRFYDSTGVSEGFFYQASTQRLGLGTTSPDTTLTVNGSSKVYSTSVLNSITHSVTSTSSYAQTITLDDTGLSFDNNSALRGYRFSNNGTERLRITSAGNVGIGTASPNGRLQVTGGTTNASNLATAYSAAAFTLVPKSTSGFSLAFGSGPSDFPYIQMSAAGTVASDMSLQPYGGNVGIGTTSPSAALDVSGDIIALSGAGTADRHIEIGVGRTGNGNSYIDLISDTTYTDFGARLIRYNSGPNAATRLDHRGTNALSLWATDAGALQFGTSNTERMRIDSSGKVGIGTASPISKIDIVHTGNTRMLLSEEATDTSTISAVNTANSAYSDLNVYANNLKLSTSGSERMRIDSSGNVGIGTSSTLGAKLFVAQGAAASPSTSGNMTTGTVVGSSITGEALNVGTDADGVWYNAAYANNAGVARIHRWLTGGTERMRIDTSGNVGISTTTTTRARLNIDTDGTNTSAGYGIALTNTAGGGSTWTLQCGDHAVNNGAFTIRETGISGTTYLKLGSGNGYLTAAGVYALTTASSANVNVDVNGAIARSTSSLRYKNTVNDATHGLTELLALRPVTYKGNNDGDTVFGGLIAEEVHDAGLTEFVTYNEDGEPDALAYGNMVSLCIKAIQEQQATITALEARIAALEAN